MYLQDENKLVKRYLEYTLGKPKWHSIQDNSETTLDTWHNKKTNKINNILIQKTKKMGNMKPTNKNKDESKCTWGVSSYTEMRMELHVLGDEFWPPKSMERWVGSQNVDVCSDHSCIGNIFSETDNISI